MSDIDRIIRQIERFTASARQAADVINKVIPPQIQKLHETMSPAIQRINEARRAFQPYISQLNVVVEKIAKHAQRWQEARKEDVTVMAENGWYPNWYTFFYSPETEPESLDDLMVNHLNEDWEEITAKIIELCPNRAHILENAFALHKSGNFIASIPLFISQADGICCEVLKSFLFTGNQTEEKILELIENDEISANILTNVFLEPFKLKNHHNAGISKHNNAAKDKAPNRNGIIHGHRCHLDYGTELNSLKCFSLLSFALYIGQWWIRLAKQLHSVLKGVEKSCSKSRLLLLVPSGGFLKLLCSFRTYFYVWHQAPSLARARASTSFGSSSRLGSFSSS